MKTKLIGALILTFAVGAFIAIQATAQDKTPATQKQPNQEEMMAVMMKYATPGPEHKALQPLIGSWDCNIKMWMEPSAPPTESKGTAENKWILGNRYVQEDVVGDMNGMPFHGMGLTGYDLYKKQYNWVWMDEMSTMIVYSSGKADSTGKVFTFGGNYDDIMTGQPKTFKAVMRIVDDNKHVFEMYDVQPDGKEVKNFEVDYTRKK
jgi:hypothetical protein